MKKLATAILLIVCVLTISELNAQVFINLNPINPTFARVSDAFNGQMINNSGMSLQIYFIGTVTNRKNNKVIALGKTTVRNYEQGNSILTEQELGPVYELDATIDAGLKNLPYGDYEICLKAFVVNSNEQKGEACLMIEVIPVTPPRLITPEDHAKIAMPYPNLMWLPPMPVMSAKVIEYDLKLVEVYPNQPVFDAIQRNFAILDIHRITGTSIVYPATAYKLEAGKIYAWRVAAYSQEGIPLGVTETWDFTLDSVVNLDNVTNKPEQSTNFIVPELTTNINTIVVHEELKIYLPDRPPKETVTIKLYNESGKEVDTNKMKLEWVSDERCVVSLRSLNLKSGKTYKVVILTTRGSEKYILIKYSN